MEPIHHVLPGDPTDTAVVERQKEALRIQAAAVVAQQAALTEEEIRLEQRRAALERQEQQLAAHLEGKRRRLVSIRDEAREAHTTLLNERAAYEQRVAEVMRDLAQARREVADGRQQLQSERRRLLDLRRRLKRRWHRNWAGERTAMQCRETALADQRRVLEKERERFHAEKAALTEARLRFNGEMEFGRRQMQSERKSLRKQRHELGERARAVGNRGVALAEAERRLIADKQHWEEMRGRLSAEAEGLQNRVRNHRRNLTELEREVARLRTFSGPLRLPAGCPGSAAEGARLSTPSIPVTHVIALPQQDDASDFPSRLAGVDILASELVDQRLVLVEQCGRLAQAQQQWQQERAAALAELDVAGRRLEEQAQELWTREQALETLEEGLRQRCEEIARRQRQLEAGRARLSAGAANWEGERSRLLADIHEREDLVQQRLGVLMELRERWDKRRHRQVFFLRAQRNRCEQRRRECAVLREEWLGRNAALEQKQRSLAEHALAMEHYRQECISKAANPKAVEKRLERLRRRWSSLHASAERSLARRRESLETEAALLEQRSRQLHQQEEQVIVQQADVSARQSAWEREQALAEIERGKFGRELQTLLRQRDNYEEQMGDLRDEVERLAHLLLDDGDVTPLSVGQAA